MLLLRAFVFIGTLSLLPNYGVGDSFMGSTFWNERYTGDGFSYDTGQEFYQGLWSSDGTSVYDHYYLQNTAYGQRQCSGCTCDEQETYGITCSSSAVTVKNYVFHNLTEDSFTAGLSTLWIQEADQFTHVQNNTFEETTGLTELVIHRTALRQLPDLSTTSVVKVVLSLNNIRFFNHNHTNYGWPGTLTHMNLIENDIEWVPPGLFSDSNIEYLALSRNHIWYFPEHSFHNMPNLRFLGLNENSLQTIATHHFSPLAHGLSSLQHLNLSHNELWLIEPGAVQSLSDLKILECDNNMFTSSVMPGEFGNAPELLHLGLSFNKIETLRGDTITNMQNLRTLILHNQSPPMSALYYNAFNNINDNLRELWVSSNALLSFPHQVLSNQQYNALESVFADNNQIEDPLHYGEDGFPPRGSTYDARKLTFDPWIKSPNIGRLWLGYNDIFELHPDDFCVLTGLWELHLSGNELDEDSTPDHVFDCLTSLRILWLGYNLYDEVPTAVKSAEYLSVIEHLYLNGNHFTYIETGDFSNLTTLTKLHLGENGIIAIENGSMAPNVQELYINNNALRFTHEEPFRDLGALSRLELQHNSIELIPDTAFHGCTSLTRLSLNENSIRRVMVTHFQDNPLTDRLYLDNNLIGYLEDGVFAHISTSNYFSLNDNVLTSLPSGGDFSSLTLSGSLAHLYLQGNRLTRITGDTFRNLQITYDLRLDDNRISVIEAGAFDSVSCEDIHLTNNLLKSVETGAFNLISAENLYMQEMYIDHLPPLAFSNVTLQESLRLNGNQILYIEEEAFDNINVEYLYLQENGLELVKGQLFGTSSSSTVTEALDLRNNNLRVLPTDAFFDVSILNVQLQDNQLFDYPIALNVLYLEDINLEGNDITTIESTTFLDQSQILTLSLGDNSINSLPTGLLAPLVNLETLDLNSNELEVFNVDDFEGLQALSTVDLSHNSIYHLSPLPNISSLSSLDLSHNELKTLGLNFTFNVFWAKTLTNIDLTNNSMYCNCYLAEWLVSEAMNITGGTCETPDSLQGTLLGYESLESPLYFEAQSSDNYTCSPVSVAAGSPEELQLNVTWEEPLAHYFMGPNITLAGILEYELTCTADDVADVTATTSDLAHTFTSDDGLEGDVQYACYVAVVYEDGSLSPRSNPAIITVIGGVSEENVTVNVEDIELPVTYYDFGALHVDFTYLPSTTTYSDPTYVPSPYGAWLAFDSTPSDDSTSEWYRELDGTNYVIEETLILRGYSSPEELHKYYTSSFFPVDNEGFQAQGFEDCELNEHNFGFTTAIRTGFVYQGNENVTIGGGEEIWLFLNRILVLQVSNDADSSTMPCKTVNIAPAAQQGGVVTPYEGQVVSGECVANTELEDEQVELELDVGERYHFTVFHVERGGCRSGLLLQAQGFDFILDDLEEPPRDYLVSIDEDLYTSAIIETMFLSDTFSVGPPFQVRILRGNEARHFRFDNNTAAVQATDIEPPEVPLVYTDIEEYSFVECPTPAEVLEEGNNTEVEQFWIAQETMLAILDLEVDYEAETEYVMVVEIVDFLRTPELTGQATLKVKVRDINDNCPVLEQGAFSLVTDPALQEAPLIQLNVTDADSTVNAEVVYVRTTYVEEPPVSQWNNSFDILDIVWPATTHVSFHILVLDQGTPTRGTYANVTVEMSNTCLIDTEFLPITYDFNVGYENGSMVLRVPGFFHAAFYCDKDLGMETAFIPDPWITASSELEFSPAFRARLNLTHDPDIGYSGGWVAATDDDDQWIQTDLQERYFYNQILIQGREEEPNWVTEFTLLTSDDGYNWTTYVTADNQTVLPGLTNNTETLVVTLDPRPVSRFLRIQPRAWEGHVALRYELIGCLETEQLYFDVSCSQCEATYYCEGDSLAKPCGRCLNDSAPCDANPTYHSFGRAEACSPCVEGWVCHEGYATPCPDFSYSTCTDTWCPANCTWCEPGHACRGGVRFECEEGTYSEDGEVAFCMMCEAGTYVNATGATVCENCAAGFTSSKMKDRCSPCEAGTYSVGDGSTCHDCLDEADCPCVAIPGPCFASNTSAAQCVNTGTGGFECLGCPPGYTGDGVTCADIDECAVHDPCFMSECHNKEPGYQCAQCPNGYYGSYEDGLGFSVQRRVYEDACNGEIDAVIYQTCNDIDECDVDHGKCDVNAHCHNTVGSFYCGECKDGWVGYADVSFPYGCRPANFCADAEDNDCNENAECIYIGPGQYKCECVNGWAGDGVICGVDEDQDGVSTEGVSCLDWGCRRDNCPDISNAGQEDNDGDALGDACDYDDDNDLVEDYNDNCPFDWNIDQADGDNDAVGDVCDNCDSDVNTDQSDVDGDGDGDVCDDDSDADGVSDVTDVCPLVPDPGQADSDGDGVGDACDNCVSTANADQADTNHNQIGDACEEDDSDGDGIQDSADNCALVPNGAQVDTDEDGSGDQCDSDLDGDGVPNDEDNCPYYPNADQLEFTGNGVGDVCEDDTDADGIVDRLDNCPKNKFMNRTNFEDFVTINLDPSSTDDQVGWRMLFDGAEIRQTVETDAVAMLIGYDNLGPMRYRGTWFVNHDSCYGYVGFVFGYQSSSKFYVVMWKHEHKNWYDTSYRGGILGVQIKIVNSDSGPSRSLAEALWHADDTSGEVELLWHDRNLIGWECKTAYRWELEHRPDIGVIRIIVKSEETILVDSGFVHDTSITGGRTGLFVHAQPGAIFSNLNYECLDRVNEALSFDGASDYLSVADVITLEMRYSFTWEAWVYPAAGYTSDIMPVICNDDRSLCVFVEDSQVKANVGHYSVMVTDTLPALSWTHVALRMDAEGCNIDLFLNGTASGMHATLSGVPAIDWTAVLSNPNTSSSAQLYIATDTTHYFDGIMDEIRLYSIYIEDGELDYHWQEAGMFWEVHQRYLEVHYNFDFNGNDSAAEDKGDKGINGVYHGEPLYVDSFVDMARFALTYPDNRRRRRSAPRLYGPRYIDTRDIHNAPFLLPGQKDHIHMGNHVGHEHPSNKSKSSVKQNKRRVARRYLHEEL